MTVIKPFAHQKKSLAHADTTPVVFDCSDPGTGKSYVRIKAFEKRRKRGGGCALVLAPKSLLHTVWANDFRKFAPGIKVVVSTAGKHAELFAQEADVYVTNVDAVKWLAKQKKPFFAKFDELIVDESTALKHHTSQRSHAAASITKHFTYRACLTGTPNSNSITDVWHQVFLLDAGKRLGNTFYGFRNAVCTPVQVGRNNNALQWTDREGAEEAVFGLLNDIVIRHKFEDCVDIPEHHRYTLEYIMSPGHRKAYEQLRDQSLMEVFGDLTALALARLQGKRPQPTGLVTAMHAGVLTHKLLQVCSGAVYESSDKYHLISTGRYEMAMDLVEARRHSLVFFLWKHQRDLLETEAKKRGISYAILDGSTKDADRVGIVAAYQRGEYQVLLAHPKSTAHGVTLTKGTTTLWVSPTYDLEIFQQGSKRQHRLGQTQKTEVITLLAQDSIEQKVYEALTAKNARMSNLLDLFATL